MLIPIPSTTKRLALCLLVSAPLAAGVHAETVRPQTAPKPKSSTTPRVAPRAFPSEINVPVLELHVQGDGQTVLTPDSPAVPTPPGAITFLVPVHVDNLKAELGDTPELMVSCGVSAVGSGGQKGLVKALVPLNQGSFYGQLRLTVAPESSSRPFVRGDAWACSLNAGNGWANGFNTYLQVNTPEPGTPVTMSALGVLK